jgi:hypothetical protein
MRRIVEGLLIVASALLVVGLIAYARGPKHYRGDEIGSHGTKVVVVHIVRDGHGPRPGHAFLRPTNRGATFAGRAGEHPDRRAS